MPIKFRCIHCRQFLGISPARAGELTDCPTCGRTVRVPNLDGTVAPLPAARIDVDDSQLIEALSAVSQIGNTRDDAGSRAASVVAMTAAVSARVVAVAAPIAVAEPPPPAVAVEPVSRTPQQEVQQPSHASPPELFIDLDAPPAERPSRTGRRRSQVTPELKIAAVVLAAAALFIAGFLAGRASHWPAVSVAPSNFPPAHNAAAPAVGTVTAAEDALAAPVAVEGVYGQITYRAASGPARPDHGARVLAVPARRPGGLPLATSGFRSGAVSADRERAMAALHALGGDYSVADAGGNFALQLAAGKYDVLFLSRHQSQAPEQALPADIDALLAACFDQPAGLVGSVAVEHRQLDFDGGSTRLDCAFSR